MVDKKPVKPAAKATPILPPEVPYVAPKAPPEAVTPAAKFVEQVAAATPKLPPGPAAETASTMFGAARGFAEKFDFSKLFKDLKVPAMPDMEALLATHKRNLEAIAEANRVAMEGAQAVARRQMEITQSTLTGLADQLKSFTPTEAPASRAAKQAELLKQAYEHAVSNTKELGDLIQKSNAEAMQKLNHRFSEAMNEVKALFNKL